jgi:DNA-binding NtrC family response regulator
MKEVLSQYGHDVKAADTAFEACRLLARRGFSFDALITDVVLPGGSFSILARLKADRRRLPVIMMTGQSDPRLRERALAMGVFAYLRKPVTGREIDRLLERALAESGRLRPWGARLRLAWRRLWRRGEGELDDVS